MALQSLNASLASATQETTLALAKLNFDFSLVKVQAPEEYRGLGAQLSTKRRTLAESGSPHIIARRLGTLFEGILPLTPKLVAAYGARASEISQSAGVASSGNNSHGAFKDFVGLDGTNIWAAATSGPSAVAVHLLACMLARVWSPAEAVSIWDEVVAQRKKHLLGNGDAEFVDTRDLVASQLSVTKDQLAEWDASARAWLRAADKTPVTLKRQKQLMLILGNIHLPVSNEEDVYKSVCRAWRSALVTVNNLVGGAPYSIQDGAPLIALSAWHLYPDIIVLGSPSREIHHSDELVSAGGVLTIGLQDRDQISVIGVQWSLSLAHLRYYGPPVRASSTLSSHSGRTTFDELIYVALGALLGSWGLETDAILEGLKLVSLFFKTAASGTQATNRPRSWLQLFSESAGTLLSAPKEERKAPLRLVTLGFR